MNIKRKFWKPIFIIYMIALFILVVIKFNGNIHTFMDRIRSISENRSLGFWNISLKPFGNSTLHYLKNITDGYAFYNIAGNIVPFIPLGFLLPIAFPQHSKFQKSMFISFLTILLIETFQFLAMVGYFDIDDIIFNMGGCLIGYMIFGIYNLIFVKHGSVYKH